VSKIAVIALVLSCLSVSEAFAKRAPPEIVAPVQSGDLEFRAPQSEMGFVEAWDIKRDQLDWRRQIYVVRYMVDLERDVQDVFIRSIELKDNALRVRNERQSEYRLDLDSLEVTVVKGSLIEKSN
jgi:hypothetical protein